jgi:hypothetical protein
MKTAAQKYSESNAEAILAYFRGVDGTFVPTPAHPSPRYPMVDDTVGIHTVRLSQSTLAGYLEQAFVAGERAEFDRLDKKARAREEGTEMTISDAELELFRDWKPGDWITVDANSVGMLIQEVIRSRATLHTIADFAVGNGDVCEIIARRARKALE